MSFQPIVPMSGYVGWRFLQRTEEAQREAHAQSGETARLTDYFRENIGKVSSLDDFMADRQLVRVALEAFGLGEDLNATAYVRKVIEEGTIDSESFANRLTDTRYADFAEALGFGNIGGAGRTQFVGFTDDIVTRFEAKQFEEAVGDQNEDMRLALNVESSLSDVMDSQSSKAARWYAIMGNEPLRAVFDTAFGFSDAFAQIDIDQQLEGYESRARSLFGTDDPADFTDPETQEKLTRLFLVRSEANQFAAATSGSIALSLLQSMPNLNEY